MRGLIFGAHAVPKVAGVNEYAAAIVSWRSETKHAVTDLLPAR